MVVLSSYYWFVMVSMNVSKFLLKVVFRRIKRVKNTYYSFFLLYLLIDLVSCLAFFFLDIL